MYAYKNENTGQIVECAEPDKRLEFLANWHRVDDQSQAEPEDLATEREHLLARIVEIDAALQAEQECAVEPESESPHVPPSTETPELERPAVRDSKEDWLAYADSRDPGDHSGMTKAELMAAYGEDA